MRKGIYVVVNFGVTLQLGEVISRMIELVEGQPEPPKVTLADARDGFLGQRLGAAVETARRLAKREIWLVSFGVTANGLRIGFRQLLQVRLGQILLDPPLPV